MPEDDSWFPIFELLATMTKLKEVRFSDFSHDNFDGSLSTYKQEDPALQTLGGGHTMTASGGDIVGRLGRAVQQRVTVVDKEVDYREHVWFS